MSNRALRAHVPLVFGHYNVTPLLLVKIVGNSFERVREDRVEFGILGKETIAINVRYNVEDQLLALQSDWLV